jgi:hypothetical protein
VELLDDQDGSFPRRLVGTESVHMASCIMRCWRRITQVNVPIIVVAMKIGNPIMK